MALTKHFDLELHQMDVNATFLIGDFDENIQGSEHLVCKLKKSIFGLKQASRKCYMKFHEVITSLDFQENAVDQCIYLKVSGSKFIFMVLYVDDISLAKHDLVLLCEIEDFLSNNFEMKDLSETSFVNGIEIHRYCKNGLLGLSQ